MNAWLARMRLNLHSREVRADLRDVDALHKRVMKLVPDELGEHARQRAGMLFRLEDSDQTATLFVQARMPLDPGRLPARYAHVEVRELAPMFAALAKGQAVRYRITANASKRKALPIGTDKRGHIIALRGAAAEDWWRHRATGAGLSLLSVVSSPVGAAQGKAIRHDLTRFEGIAIIEDPQAVTTAVLEGIGRGKSYGGGLLSLAPARSS